MTTEAGADTADTTNGAHGPSDGLVGLPASVRVKLRPEIVERLVAHEQAVTLAERVRDSYQQGLVDGLGFPLDRVQALDVDRGELVVADAE
jgi:hypothetical protein